MMFLSALDAAALKVTLRRSSHLSWDETGGTTKIEGRRETRGRKHKSNSLVNDVRKLIGDLTTIEGRVNSHRKTSFLFLRSVSDGL
jgi:hypothetical protein